MTVERPESDTPTHKLHTQGGLNVNDRLERIENLLELLVTRLAQGDTSLAMISLRVRALEVIVYGACGLGLMAIAYAILHIVIPKGGAS